jgi:hypothetical protein
LAIAFFLVVGIFIWRTYAYRSLEDAIRAKGEPLTLAELDAWYTPVPEERNAAQVVLVALDRFQEPPSDAPIPFITKFKWDAHGAPLPDESKRAVAECLVANKECLDLIAQATALPESRYPFAVSTALTGTLPHLARIRGLTRLQLLEVIYKAQTDDMAGATDSAIRLMRLGETLKNEPILISQLVRLACHSMAFDSVDELLNRGPSTEERLKALQEQVRALDDSEAMHRAFAGERCFVTDTSYKYGGGMNDVLLQFFRGSTTRILTRAVDASRLPSVDRRIQLQQIEQSIPTPGKRGVPFFLNPLASILFPAWTGTVDAFDRDAAQLRVAATAIAAERYRLANGMLPDTLDALVPTYLESVPVDPFDGKPLRYIRHEVGYTVYSIGIDLKNDQGAEPPKGNAKVGDIVLKVSR